MGININFDLESKLSDFPCEIKNSALRAEKINISDYPEAMKIASVWQRVAEEKEMQAISETEREQFSDCAYISESFVYDFKDLDDPSTIYACKDLDGNYQGFMGICVQENKVYVELLVTNPINIRSQINEQETKKVRGARTCLLNMAEEIAIQEGKESVYLTPLDSAVGFYQKNGFTTGPSTNPWCYSMSKIVQKIHDYVA